MKTFYLFVALLFGASFNALFAVEESATIPAALTIDKNYILDYN